MSKFISAYLLMLFSIATFAQSPDVPVPATRLGQGVPVDGGGLAVPF